MSGSGLESPAAPLPPLLPPGVSPHPVSLGSFWRNCFSKTSFQCASTERCKGLGRIQNSPLHQKGSPWGRTLCSPILCPSQHERENNSSRQKCSFPCGWPLLPQLLLQLTFQPALKEMLALKENLALKGATLLVSLPFSSLLLAAFYVTFFQLLRICYFRLLFFLLALQSCSTADLLGSWTGRLLGVFASFLSGFVLGIHGLLLLEGRANRGTVVSSRHHSKHARWSDRNARHLLFPRLQFSLQAFFDSRFSSRTLTTIPWN